MSKKIILILVFLFVIASSAGAEQVKSTIDDQKNIAITIYNNNLGLVKDTREIKLDKGVQEVQFMDVATQINPVTVHIKSLTTPDKLSVLEQNYEYDLLNSNKLFDKYVGKRVKIVEENQYTGTEKTYDAEVLSNNQGPIFKIDDQIYIGSPGRVIFPQIPDNLIAKPTLVWLLDNENTDMQEIEASYLTNGITWKADYIAVINEDNTRGDLNGWVTINNQSGAAYNDAKVKLVAGEVNRVRNEIRGRGRPQMTKSMELASMADTGFKEEGFFEYHLYTLQRPSTIKENQTKQIELLSANDFPMKERMIYYGSDRYFRNRYTGQMESKENPGVFLEIENKKENNLGMPLPAGIVRVYKKDKEGSLQFIGEDRINHTPKNEKIKLKMGNAFDVVIERKQTDYRRLSKSILQPYDVEMEWKIDIRNHKEVPTTVEVVERVPASWDMVTTNTNYKKTEANTIEFVIDLNKDEIKTILYRVKVKY